jgi:hypothetical protein
MVKWLMFKNPYGFTVSGYGDSDEYLRKEGYVCVKKMEYGKNKKFIYKKGNSLIELVRVKEGLPARSVHERISPNMVRTRLHGTPDEYKLRKRKAKK